MTWNSRGLRGSTLENLINMTNDKYRDSHLALIQKVPTPITPLEINKGEGIITKAFFEQKSTVDYIGVVQGIPVCFDAKENAGDTFRLQNIHPHQVQFMKEFEEQGGVAFFLIYFSERDLYYYLRFREFYPFWQRGEEGGRKSFRYEELQPRYEISPHKSGVFVHYLEMLNQDLADRESEGDS